VQAIRANGKSGTKVGPAENIETAVPLIEAPEHIEAAKAATRERNAPFLTVMLEGKYTDAYLEENGKDAPKFTDEDLNIIGSPLDFVGINVYCPVTYVVASDEPPGSLDVPFAKGHAKAAVNNFPIGPECLYWAPKFVQSLWGAKEIFITENGCAGDEVIADDGNIYDTDRVMFIRAHLTQLQRATDEGVPVGGYFYWSSQDNLEWTAGFGNRFGLVYVDFDTLERKPKLSAEWFREASRQNAVV
jgi:beta-glucosidase